jgi:hypothetical protein
MSFEPFRHILSRAISKQQVSPALQIARVFDVARTVLTKLWGEEQAAYVSPVSFHEGTLKLQTTSASAKQQLGIDTLRVQNEINRVIGQKVVQRITIISKGF